MLHSQKTIIIRSTGHVLTVYGLFFFSLYQGRWTQTPLHQHLVKRVEWNVSLVGQDSNEKVGWLYETYVLQRLNV